MVITFDVLVDWIRARLKRAAQIREAADPCAACGYSTGVERIDETVCGACEMPGAICICANVEMERFRAARAILVGIDQADSQAVRTFGATSRVGLAAFTLTDPVEVVVALRGLLAIVRADGEHELERRLLRMMAESAGISGFDIIAKMPEIGTRELRQSLKSESCLAFVRCALVILYVDGRVSAGEMRQLHTFADALGMSGELQTLEREVKVQLLSYLRADPEAAARLAGSEVEVAESVTHGDFL